MNFAGIGAAELLVILIVALLIFGPKKLPEIAKDLGKNIGKWRQALEEIEDMTDVSGTLGSTSSKEAEMQRAVQTVMKHKKGASDRDEAGTSEGEEEGAEVEAECQT